MPSLNISFAGTGETRGRTGFLFLLSQSRACTGIRSLLFCSARPSALDSLQFKHPMETHSKGSSFFSLENMEGTTIRGFLYGPTLYSTVTVMGLPAFPAKGEMRLSDTDRGDLCPPTFCARAPRLRSSSLHFGDWYSVTILWVHAPKDVRSEVCTVPHLSDPISQSRSSRGFRRWGSDGGGVCK
jgi:hypothetical protein